GVARGRGLRKLAVAQQDQRRSDGRLCRFRQGVAEPPIDRCRDGKAQARGETAAAGGKFASRRGRSTLWPGRFARPPWRRGTRSRLFAAFALSLADASAGAALARRPLRVAEEAGSGDQGL